MEVWTGPCGNRGSTVYGNQKVQFQRILQESRNLAFPASVWVWFQQSSAASGCPPPCSRPRLSAGQALPGTGLGQGWGLREMAAAALGVLAGLSVACV